MFEVIFILAIFLLAFICFDKWFSRRRRHVPLQKITMGRPHDLGPGSVLILSEPDESKPVLKMFVVIHATQTTLDVKEIPRAAFLVESSDEYQAAINEAEQIRIYGKLYETDDL